MKKMIWFVAMFCLWFCQVPAFSQPLRAISVPEAVQRELPESFKAGKLRLNANAGNLPLSATRTIYEYHAFSLEPGSEGMVFVGYGAAAGELAAVRMKIVEENSGSIFSRVRIRPQLSYKGAGRHAEMSTYQEPLRAIARAGWYTFSATWAYPDGHEEDFVFKDTEVGPMVVWWDGCRHGDGSIELFLVPIFLDKEPDPDRVRIEAAPLVDGQPGKYVLSKEPDFVRANIEGMFWFLQVPLSREEYQKLYDLGTVSFRIRGARDADGMWAPRLDIGLPRAEVFDYCE